MREMTADVGALQQALQQAGLDVFLAQPSQIDVQMSASNLAFTLDGKDLRPDLVFGWSSLHQRERGKWLLSVFELAGVPVLNAPSALEPGQNKFLGSALLVSHGFAHISTWVVGAAERLPTAAQALGWPLVFKPIYGAKGEGVQLLHDAQSLAAACAPFFERNLPVYLQQYIRKPGRDIRVRVIDYVADFAFYRYATAGEFVTNLSLGGAFKPAPLNDELRLLAERCARAFQAQVAGIDICEDEDGNYRVIEVNMTPAFTWPHMQSVDKVVQMILRRLAEQA